MANLTMLAWPALDPVGSAGQVVGTTLATAAASFDLPEATRAVLDLQRQIQRSLAQEFRAAHESGSAFGPLVLMAMAFAFGAVHAVATGRGVLLSRAGRRGTPRPYHECQGDRDARALGDRARDRHDVRDRYRPRISSGRPIVHHPPISASTPRSCVT
jgi:hypothetical protein